MSNKPFSLIEDKLDESRFFLSKMISSGDNVIEFRYYFSAYVSACRSVTFVLQAVMKGVPGFAEWYSEKQNQLNQNLLARFFVERRNETLKEGENQIHSHIFAQTEDGRKLAEYFFERSGSRETINFNEDVVTSSSRYLGILMVLVSECKSRFSKSIDPLSLLTLESVQAGNITLEDIEEMLGYPRGWTADLPSDDRLRLLKNYYIKD